MIFPHFGLRIARPSFAVAGSVKGNGEDAHFTLITVIDLEMQSLAAAGVEILSDFSTCLARFRPVAGLVGACVSHSERNEFLLQVRSKV